MSNKPAKQDKNSPKKKTPAPAVTPAQSLPDGPAVEHPNMTTAEADKLLNAPHLPQIQRQQNAAHLGRQHGNQFLQRLVLQRHTSVTPLYDEDSVQGKLLDAPGRLLQRHTSVTPLYEEDSVQAQRLPDIQRGLAEDLNEAMDGWGADDDRIIQAINDASPDERKTVLTDARLVARLRDELSRSKALEAITALGATLSYRLEIAMDGWFAESSEILAMTETAPADQKQAVLRNSRLINKLSDELSREDALTALNNLGASLIVRLNTAMDGWSVDVQVVQDMVDTASDTDKQAALRDRALIDRLKESIGREQVQPILVSLGVSLVDRLNAAMDGWGVDEQAIIDMAANATPEDKAAVIGDNHTIQRLAEELSVSQALTVYTSLGLSLADRINTALNGWGVDVGVITTMIQAADEIQRQTVLADSATIGRLQSSLSEEDYNQVRLLLRFGNQEAIDAASEEEIETDEIPENLTSKLSTELDSDAPNGAKILTDIMAAAETEREMVRTNHSLMDRLSTTLTDEQFTQALEALGGSVVDRLYLMLDQEAEIGEIVLAISSADETNLALINANRPLIDALLAYAADEGDRDIMDALGDSLTNQLNHAIDEGQDLAAILALIQASNDTERDTVLLNSQLVERLDNLYDAVDFWRVRLYLHLGGEANYPAGLADLIDSWRADGTYGNIRSTIANLSDSDFAGIRAVIGIHDCVRELVVVPHEIQFILRMLDQGLMAEEGDVEETWSEELLETQSTAPLVFEAKTFTGHTGFDIAYFRDRLQVDVRINLTAIDDQAETELETLKGNWKGGIEGVWDNVYNLRNSDRNLPIRIYCHFTSSDPHHSINVREGPERSNAGLWDTKDTNLVAAHEFGHLLGSKDEYSLSADDYQDTVGTDPTADPDANSQSDTTGQTRFTNTGNVMGSTSSGDIDKRHLNEMLNWLNSNRVRGDDGTFAEPAFTII